MTPQCLVPLSSVLPFFSPLTASFDPLKMVTEVSACEFGTRLRALPKVDFKALVYDLLDSPISNIKTPIIRTLLGSG